MAEPSDNPRVAQDGWISARTRNGDVHVHVARNDAGEQVITDVLVSAADVTTDVLRRIQPARILASARGDDIDVVKLVAFTGLDDTQLTLGELRSRATSRIKGQRRRALGRPDGSNPDAFYRRVARAYRSAAIESSHAAKLLAEENDVPVETVRRWIKEARRRGYLPPGRRGRAG